MHILPPSTRVPTSTALRAALTLVALLGTGLPARAQCQPHHDARLQASDGSPTDIFGRAVALDGAGQLAVVGMPGDDDSGTDAGAAYVFARSGSTWSQQGKLLASDGLPGDLLGTSVAISADGLVVLVGAQGADPLGNLSGAAYVFVWTGASWVQNAKLLAADGGAGNAFGVSVALDATGARAAVGAIGKGDAGPASGATYVFQRSGTSWSQMQKLLASDAQAQERFGFALAFSSAGERLVASAINGDGVVADSGQAYVFLETGGVWSEEAKLFALDGAANDLFGNSVDMSAAGDVVAVGVEWEDDGGMDAGAAYVFRRTGSAWSQSVKLISWNPEDFASFGETVSLDAAGARLLVGTPEDNLDRGSAYLFEHDGASWQPAARLAAVDGSAGDLFGQTVALSGDGLYAIAGAQELGGSQGAAYVFEVPCPRLLVHCSAKTTSGGCVPQIGATGQPSASAGSGFTITATQLEPQQLVVLFYGLNGPAGMPFQGGTLCVLPPVARLAILSSGGAAACSGQMQADFNAWIASGIDPALQAGVQVDAQWWGRDPGDPFGTSLSNALEFTIQP